MQRSYHLTSVTVNFFLERPLFDLYEHVWKSLGHDTFWECDYVQCFDWFLYRENSQELGFSVLCHSILVTL
jgi:hypothetical protein